MGVAMTRRNGSPAFSTTGVYCRPSCAARQARRENVSFHATPAEAERAGFRPCKRCRPDSHGLLETRAQAVARACRLIETAEEMPSLDALADAAGLSRFHFHRVFKTTTGLTPRAYAAAHRARRVRDELSRSERVTDAIYGAGFSSSGRFYATASEVLGMTPTDFRAGGDGAVIRFAVGECSLGSILVAATERGVCSILLGDEPDALARDLQRRFPNARVIGVHVLRNILIPIVTVIGLEFGSVIAFAIVTETVFAWPGMGKLLIDSINLLDRPIIVAYLLVIVFMFILINLVVDILYSALDPRVRLSEAKG